VFTTSASLFMAGTKFDWLKRNGFEPTEKDYIEIRDKSFLNTDYMLDDRFDNVYNFPNTGILFSAPWNERIIWKDRVNNWEQVVFYFYKRNKQQQL
jgi:5'(3')-deoxyribonucleotidase